MIEWKLFDLGHALVVVERDEQHWPPPGPIEPVVHTLRLDTIEEPFRSVILEALRTADRQRALGEHQQALGEQYTVPFMPLRPVPCYVCGSISGHGNLPCPRLAAMGQ